MRKRSLNFLLASTFGAGLEMEKLVMGYANKGVSGDDVGGRRKAVQDRGKNQTN